MKKIQFIGVLLLIPLLCFSQERSVEEAYLDYFKLPRESLFLHTNKTTYIIGESEEIWFTAYAYDRKSHLSSKVTTNIHLGLYNAFGEQIEKKLFLADKGIATGNLALDSTLVTGDYYLKVHTQWMKNFKEDDSFIQKIRVINPKDMTPNTIEKTIAKEYDIQFLPEGGYLLAGVKNTIGIKALDDYGKGTQLSGVILNSKGEEIASIKTNFLGLGKFSFTPEFEESYTAKITLDNSKELVQEIPNAEEKGITIRINNLRNENVLIDIITNEESFPMLKGKEFKLLIHQNGTAKIIPVTMDHLIERISIDKLALFKGVNTVTLFREKAPLLERMFFNDAPIVQHSLAIDSWESEGDSIHFKFNSTLKDSIVLSASISVLPQETKSYNPKHSIISAFYLKPYLRGSIENPSYYFDKTDRKKKYALDLLLMTQGWSRYDWNDIFQSPPQMNYNFENGIVINGSLNNDIKDAPSLILYPTKNNSSRFVEYDTKGRFRIENYFPLKNEELRFSFVNKRGKAQRPKMAVNSLLKWEKDQIDVRPFQEYVSYYADKNAIPLNFLNKNEVLDEIVLSARLDPVFKKKGPKFSGRIIKINDTLVKQNITLDRVLKKERFIIEYVDVYNVQIKSLDRRPVFFFVDGVIVRPENMHDFLTSYLTKYEDVYIDYSYNIVNDPFNRNFPTEDSILVNVFSRVSGFDDPNLTKIPTNIVKVLHGFEKTKKFYTPRYIDYNIPAFKNYGVIHWEPNMTFEALTKAQLTTMNTGLKEVSFYIEGISSTGDLISQKITYKIQ